MKYIQKYGYVCDEAKIADSLKNISAELDKYEQTDVLKKCFSLMDLTTLKTNDTAASVSKLVAKTNAIKDKFPGYPFPASICVYPCFAEQVSKERCSSEIHVTTTSGCFPASQSFTEVKVLECEMSVLKGADEIDIVLAVGEFLGGNEQAAFDQIAAMRKAIDEAAKKCGRKVVLKVILETGLLVTEENIAEASLLAMEAGADFIKTSTGKVEVNATPTAAFIMCECIDLYYKATGRKVGFKAAGGISTAKDALCYYAIVDTILGAGWLCKDLFRLGVSRLGNSLMSAIEQGTVTYF